MYQREKGLGFLAIKSTEKIWKTPSTETKITFVRFNKN